MNFLNFSVLALATTLFFIPNDVDAQIFKCVAADGDVKYNEKPCGYKEDTGRVLTGITDRHTPLDCRLTGHFSGFIAEAMKQGRQADEVFNHFGGRDEVSPATRLVIEHVYGYQRNDDISMFEIAGLSLERCELGAFTENVSCADYPQRYLNEVGGCDVASGVANENVVASAKPTAAAQADNQSDNVPKLKRPTATASLTRPAAEPVLAAAVSDNKKVEDYADFEGTPEQRQMKCHEVTSGRLDAVRKKLNGELSEEEQVKYEELQLELRSEFEAC